METLFALKNVKIREPGAVRAKLERIIADGKDNLHVISDFDATMSTYWKDRKSGCRNTSAHGMVGRARVISPECKATTEALLAEYYPIEISRDMTQDEKIPHMIDWWHGAHQALIGEKLTKQDVTEIVSESDILFRDGLKQVLDDCFAKDIPFLVFSAGIADVIEESLKQHGLWHPNMHIVSNKMRFNEQGICDHFKEPLIHVFNKSEFQIETTDYYENIAHRRNLILLGDSLGDLQMKEGVRHDLYLTIGFLNHDEEELLDKYLHAYDILVLYDGSWNAVDAVLRQID
ncbi:hypothetical protein BZG36_04814 [Bifiguratus adelaidae]|uniref:5'-nucleotidase n=1 Tax=Bifiguratus adelaidae TaxID=1938954 RepID=A0A261XTW4_9FUNG|nr:hypothetical protein BZG36_04814 [Bifiguratus adelaidae]